MTINFDCNQKGKHMNRDFLTSFVNPSMESTASFTGDTFEEDAMFAEHASLGFECAYQEVESVNRSISDLEEIATSLEEIAQNAEASITEGGLDRQAAVMMASGVCAQTRRLGVENILPSMESFGGSSGRITATTVSLEGIKEFIDNIWRGIVNAFEYMKKRIREFWLKYFDSLPRIMKAAKAMKQKLDKLKSTPEEKKFKVTNLKSVHIDGKFPSDFKGKVAQLAEMAKNIKDTSGSRKVAEEYADALGQLKYDTEKEFVTSAGDLRSKLLPVTEGIADKVVPELTEITDEKKLKRFGADLKVSASVELMGGKMAYAQIGILTASTEAEEGDKGNNEEDKVPDEMRKQMITELKNNGKIKAGITNFSDKDKEVESSVEADTLPISDMNDILDDVISACGTLMDYKKNQPKDDKAGDKAKDASEKFLKAVKKSENGNSLEPYTSQIASLSTVVANLATGFPAEMGKYVGGMLSSVMSVVSRSASQYKKS